MNDEKREQLIKLLGMMGSSHDGEILNAARLAQRLIGSLGQTWEEVLNTNGNGRDQWDEGYRAGYAIGIAQGRRDSYTTRPTRNTWFNFVRTVQEEYYDDLNDWEQGFIDNFVERQLNNPSPKQRNVLEKIADKIGIDCPDA